MDGFPRHPAGMPARAAKKKMLQNLRFHSSLFQFDSNFHTVGSLFGGGKFCGGKGNFVGKNLERRMRYGKETLFNTLAIHVWYIYLHLVEFFGNYR